MDSTTSTSAPWGAIFDWDGVIIDSSSHHEESWERLARELERSLPEGHFKAGFGRKNEFIVPEILRWTTDPAEIVTISLRKEALYREVVADRGIDALPGVRTWLERLRDAGVPCAIGSSTHRANIDLSLGLIGLREFFADIVSAEDVTRGKPDPQVFLTAAARIERAPERCVVFEDAYVGLEAARTGGMKCVAVATTHAPEDLRPKSDRVVHRLDELQPADLTGWFEKQ
jgi:HAD superfamily hydrolase (TIGR01509 family)